MPFFAKLFSFIAGAGSVKLRLNLMRSLHGLSTRKSVPFQAAGMVDRFDCADQYLFRVAATQRAGATKRLMVDDCDTPSGPAGSGKLSPWRRFRCR
jgi:hypothetical protein